VPDWLSPGPHPFDYEELWAFTYHKDRMVGMRWHDKLNDPPSDRREITRGAFMVEAYNHFPEYYDNTVRMYYTYDGKHIDRMETDREDIMK